MISIAERTTRVGVADISWVESGSGDPPFVLVHGLGSSTVKWLEVLPLLGAHRRAIALDLPGFGRSSAVPGRYSPAWFAGAIRAFMDAIGVASAIPVGNSLGGLAVAYLAGAWPERCEGLVLVSPALPNEGPQPSARIVAGMAALSLPLVGPALLRSHLRRPAEEVTREALARNVADPSRVSPRTVALLEEEARARAGDPDRQRATLAATRRLVWALTGMREATWRALRAVRVPTMFLWGSRDAMVPLEVGERAVREVPGAHLVVLDGLGHNPQIEDPEAFAAAVTSFARALAARAPA